MTDDILPGFDTADTLPEAQEVGSHIQAQAGSPARFGRRWRLVGAGLSNVWRFGDLELAAASGRLLMRGPNGTGKTTALEALWPYLLDLNATRLAAGKARPTSLSSLMREGAAGKRRCGYVWLTLVGPEPEGVWSFGVRLQYAEGGSPAVRVVPFTVPGRPLHELSLYATGRAPLTAEQFTEAVTTPGGQVFDDEETYVAHLAVRIFGTPTTTEMATLASRLRQVRNPTLLGDVSPKAAADALRESLPGVAEDVIIATADALAESDATRDAFERDRDAAALLEDFKAVWCGHAVDVVRAAHNDADEAARSVSRHASEVKTRIGELQAAVAASGRAKAHVEGLDADLGTATAQVQALEKRQEYQQAGRLKDLQRTLTAQRAQADAAVAAMREAAASTAAAGRSLRHSLTDLAEDLAEQATQVGDTDLTVTPDAPLLSWTDRPRAVLSAGDITADPGPGLAVHGNAEQLRSTAAAWRKRATEHGRKADAAALALTDHKQVEAAQVAADLAEKAAADSAARADQEAQKSRQAHADADAAATKLLALVRTWTEEHSDLAAPQPFDHSQPRTESGAAAVAPDDDTAADWWTLSEIHELAGAEPGQLLVTTEAWASHALGRAEHLAAALQAQAQQADREAHRFREDAARLRTEAHGLREGRLLPLPRPNWAGPGDDTAALGAALDWAEPIQNQRERDVLEATLGATGLLGATLASDGAGTALWRVDAAGPEVRPNLADAISVDSDHPLAASAAAVLARIHLATTAHLDSTLTSSSALVIGRDGTFRAGVLHGRVPGADAAAQLPTATHVGARQRRAAALARADALDEEAADLDQQAGQHAAAAEFLTANAGRAAASGRTFPTRGPLRSAESQRAAVARATAEASEAAQHALAEARRHKADLQHARTYWMQRTRARDLPPDVEQLTGMRDHGKQVTTLLHRAADAVGGKLADRLDRILSQSPSEPTIQDKLSRAQAGARTAHRAAAETATELNTLVTTAGAAIQETLTKHKAASDYRDELEQRLGPAREQQVKAAGDEGAARTALVEARKHLADAEPKAVAARRALRAVLEVPGVADAVLSGSDPTGDDHILAQVATALAGKKTMTKRTVRERADTARAQLAGVWSLDPGEDHGDLLTYVLTHRDAAYTPTQAAVHATTLKRRAEQALAVSEEKALREFIIGRLPGAIGTAWTRLRDWVTEVNRKMRTAAASSGVGVQVRVTLRDDLSHAAHTVHRLSCLVSDADRTDDQKNEVGAALQALLAAAYGETMHERLASAVDVRDWVDVHYEVTRPGGKSQRWNSKTGLSGGERRLVVLAPMLAAIAAAYDRFGDEALRLAALDEVPAEVDDRGREGLARYIADLDLDLVCTSYLWDGSPGAWDGIDAHDMEAGPDGTVVAFPMLVRGLLTIPANLDDLDRAPNAVDATAMNPPSLDDT